MYILCATVYLLVPCEWTGERPGLARSPGACQDRTYVGGNAGGPGNAPVCAAAVSAAPFASGSGVESHARVQISPFFSASLITCPFTP